MAKRSDGTGRPTRPWLVTAVLAASLLAGIGLLVVMVFLRAHAAGPDSTVELAHLKMLGTALKLHAEEHGGKFPPTIADIDWRQNLPGMQWAGLPAAVSRFHDPTTGALMKWSYYPGHVDTDPPRTILAASPVPIGAAESQRLVARIDGTAEASDEATYQVEIKHQATAR
jgi:hypothetical protein